MLQIIEEQVCFFPYMQHLLWEMREISRRGQRQNMETMQRKTLYLFYGYGTYNWQASKKIILFYTPMLCKI